MQVGGKNFFDLFDFVSSNVLMPLAASSPPLCWLGMGIRADDDGADQWRQFIPQAPVFIIRHVSPLLIPW